MPEWVDDDGEILEAVLGKLENVRKHGGYWMARCPAHEDSTASLSIARGTEYPVVFKCHAGCERDAILTGMGMTLTDILPPRRETGEWTPHGEAQAIYDYVDEEGKLLFQVLRAPGKKFLQRRPDAASRSGWAWKLGETRRVIYRLPRVIKAVNAGETIYVVEGEKDVHNVEKAGATATCNPHGAGKWREEYSESLREAHVIIVSDKDDPGYAHARQVAAFLKSVASSVEIREAAQGKDVTNHLEAGLGLERLVVTWTDKEPPADLAPDLHEFLAIVDPPMDFVVGSILERSDRLMITGFEGLGKSHLIRQMAVCAAAGLDPFDFTTVKQSRVLFIDAENSERQSRRALRPLGALAQKWGHPVPPGGLRLIHRPRGMDLTKEEGAAWLLERATAHQPDVIMIGPFYRLHLTDANEETAARMICNTLDLARIGTDCAVIIEHHVGHGEKGNRSVRPIGSSFLLRWPEFGFGIKPVGESDPVQEITFQSWRGPRDQTRRWPKKLYRGMDGEWPWGVGAGGF